VSKPLTRSELLPAGVVEEMLKTLVKALRAFQMYLPNNPIYQKAQQNITESFRPIWEVLDELELAIVETDFHWEDQVVYHQPNKNESLAWTLYKDGMRVLTLKSGAERRELVKLLEVVHKARMLPAEADDDLNTLLWEQQFEYIQYQFTEFLTDGTPIEYTGEHASPEPAVVQQAVQEELQPESATEGAPSEGRKTGIVDIEDFDSTLYFLEESEISYIAKALEQEYSQDLRTTTLNILLDLLEQQPEDAVRSELFGILETLMPNMLQGGEFRAVAMILREVRAIGERARELTAEQRQRLENFRSQLSEPTVLTQMLQAVDEATAAPSVTDLGELFRELRPGSLETILVWLPRIATAFVRDLLVEASERLAAASPNEVLRLLRMPESEALMGTVDLCGRLELQGSVPGLTETLAHQDRTIRLASVKSLTAVGSAGALQALEKALDDSDREVRIAGVRALGARGYKNALKRIQTGVLEGGLKDADLTERIAFFEAFAAIAGPTALEPLSRVLIPGGMFRRKFGPEDRACAAIALSRLRTEDARAILQQAANDKDLVVRNAVNRALRETTSGRVQP
jgi:hypothetical protein